MTELKTPATRPANPRFSSGPCAKIPHYNLEMLADAPLGRSHRAAVGKSKLAEAIELTRDVLNVPADYRIGIVPGSDTGAVEMAMWTMLGARPVEMLAWESFGEGWVTDAVKQLKLDATSARPITARSSIWQRSISTRTSSSPGTAPQRRARAERRRDPRGPRGPDHLRRDQRGLRHGPALGQAGCGDLQLAEGAGRRGRAWRPDPVAARRRAAGDLSPPGRCPRSSA